MKQKAKEKVSVIIPTKNRTKDIIRCLKSILIQTRLPDEVVIVDSSDIPELKSKLSEFKKLNIKYIHTTKAGGCYQRNIGIEKSSGDILHFSDDDTIWEKNHLKEILYVFNHKENVGGVTGSPILEKDNLIKKVIKFIYFKIYSPIFFLQRNKNGKFQASGIPTTIENSVDKIMECEFLYGFSMAFRREVIEEFMFDKNMMGYGREEDDDVEYRVSRKYQNYYTPFAKIHHIKSPSRVNSYIATRKLIECRYYVFKKNFPQGLKYRFCFWWSMIGLIIKEIIIGIIKGNFINKVRGLKDGLKEVLKIN